MFPLQLSLLPTHENLTGPNTSLPVNSQQPSSATKSRLSHEGMQSIETGLEVAELKCKNNRECRFPEKPA